MHHDADGFIVKTCDVSSREFKPVTAADKMPRFYFEKVVETSASEHKLILLIIINLKVCLVELPLLNTAAWSINDLNSSHFKT